MRRRVIPESVGTAPAGALTVAVFSSVIPPPVSPPRSPRRRRLWPVAALAVAVIVVLSLWAGGILTPSGSKGPSASVTYSQAAAIARSAATMVPGGPWVEVGAAGIDSQRGLSANLSATTTGNCSFTPAEVGPIPSGLTIPSYSGSFSSGSAPWWDLVYLNRGTQELLTVAVVNGTAQPLAVGTGPCVESLLPYNNVPSSLPDSPTVASAVWNGGGSAFAAQHTNVPLNLVIGLFGGGTISSGSFGSLTLGASWIVSISPCGLTSSTSPSGSQPMLLALVNASTGSLVSPSPIVRSSTCSNSSFVVPLGFTPRPGPAGPTTVGLVGREGPVGVRDLRSFSPAPGTLSPQIGFALRVCALQVFR